MFSRFFKDPFKDDDFFEGFGGFRDLERDFMRGAPTNALESSQVAAQRNNNGLRASRDKRDSKSKVQPRNQQRSNYKDNPIGGDDNFSDNLLVPSRFSMQMPSFMRQFDSVFGNMESSLNELEQQMRANHSNSAAYTSSSVYSYQAGPDKDGKPQVYHAQKSVRTGPDGLREERRAVHDSRRQFEKMSMGRHLGGRGRTVEHHRDLATNQHEEKRNYFEISESEADQFDRDWNERANQTAFFGGSGGGRNWDFGGIRGGVPRAIRDGGGSDTTEHERSNRNRSNQKSLEFNTAHDSKSRRN